MTLPPIVSPLFRVEDDILQYKPYPSYPSWLEAWDVSGFTGDASAAMAAAVAAQATADTAITNAATALAAANEADDTADTAQATADTALTNAATALAAANEADDTADAAQATANTALANAAAAAKPKNRRVTLWHDEANVSGGTLTQTVDALQNYATYSFSTASGFNAVQSFDCDDMPACKLKFLGVTGNNYGIMAVYIDENLITTVDWYSAALTRNVIKSISFAANAIAAGRHTIRLEVTTKNASSSSFTLTLTKYWLVPDNDSV